MVPSSADLTGEPVPSSPDPASLVAEPPGDAPDWHARSAVDVLAGLGVDADEGLTTAEVERRVDRHGPNRLAEPPQRPRLEAVPRPVPQRHRGAS